MGKLKIYEAIVRGEKKLLFWCKACSSNHSVDTDKIEWNGDNYTPTINADIKIISHKNIKCHSFIKNGHIIYLDESEHEYRGKKIELDEFYH